MRGERINILMVEDNNDFVELIRRALSQAREYQVDMTTCGDLESALEYLSKTRFDAIVLDLALPDSKGLNTFSEIRLKATTTPIVVLTVQDNMELALNAMRQGAQDYLVKGKVNAPLLVRSLRYAIERQNMLDTLRQLSMVDELTGLYNRRGFINLSEQHIKLAQRNNTMLILLMLDLDGMKQINDLFGHPEGDAALVRVAEILRKTFRSSDVIARLGGDEFVVLAIDVPPSNVETIVERLRENAEAVNKTSKAPYRISFSVGTAVFGNGEKLSVSSLIAVADKSLYQDKEDRSRLQFK